MLRLSMAGAILTYDQPHGLGESGQWLLAIGCVSLILGAGARWSALAAVLALIALGPPMRLPQDLVIVGSMVALVLSGPGAYSIDARIWGRVRVRSRSSR